MRFYTDKEAEEWLRAVGREVPQREPSLRVRYPKEAYRFYGLASVIANRIVRNDSALLLIEAHGIWSGSENWHLYYRLRQSYGDLRLLDEAPGHLFLAHEAPDLTSFVQLAMLSGWDAWLADRFGYSAARFSHDEVVDVFTNDDTLIADLARFH